MAERDTNTLIDKILSIRIRPLVLFCSLFVIIILGIMLIEKIRTETNRIENSVTDLRIQRDQIDKANKEKERELENMESDDFVIATVRNQYGYVGGNELLFYVKNPEALGEYNARSIYVEEEGLQSVSENDAEEGSPLTEEIVILESEP